MSHFVRALKISVNVEPSCCIIVEVLLILPGAFAHRLLVNIIHKAVHLVVVLIAIILPKIVHGYISGYRHQILLLISRRGTFIAIKS